MITLHHAPQSRSMRVLWLLHELGLEVEVVTEAMDRSLRRADYLARSPAGRVPALLIDGRVLFESGAILEYLCERHPEAGLAPMPGQPERADFLIWLHFAETLSQHSAALTQQHVILREDAMRSPIVMRLEAARVGKCYDAIEARLAQSGDHLLRSGFSAADVAVGQAVYMARHFRRLDGLPHLGAWMDRLSARPAFVRALPGAGDRLYPQEFYAAWEEPA